MSRPRRSAPTSAVANGVPRGVPLDIATGVVELHDEPDGAVTVLVNGVPSSVLRADNELDFEYMRHCAAAISAWDRQRGDHRWLALHVGAAACTLPRHLAATHPQSRHIAVDVDPTLARLARTWWDLPRAPRLRVRAQDGLAALAERTGGSLDVIVRDAFAGDRVPAHLAGGAWWGHAARVLRPGGLVAANTGSAPGSDAAAADALAARGAFAQVIAVAEHAVLKRRRRGNVVLVATTRPQENLVAALERYAASAALPTGVSAAWA